MKIGVIGTTAAIACFLQTALNAQQPTPKDEKDRISYSIGCNVGNVLKQQTQQLTINPEMVAAGVRDVLSGGKTLLTEQEIQETLSALQRDMVGKQAELGEKNKKAGESFLADNKKKAGIKATASGLQYQVLTEGKGAKPKVTDTVKVNYKGTLIDGTVFDSSEKHGPVTFPLNGVIKGWTEALQLMSVGSKWRLFIPSELAYGQQGAGGAIGPNSALIFEVELLSIEPASKG